MQILRSKTLPSGDSVLIVETKAPDQGQHVDVARVVRAVRVPAGTKYAGARTKGVTILAAAMYYTTTGSGSRLNGVWAAFDAEVAADLQAVGDADTEDEDFSDRMNRLDHERTEIHLGEQGQPAYLVDGHLYSA